MAKCSTLNCGNDAYMKVPVIIYPDNKISNNYRFKCKSCVDMHIRLTIACLNEESKQLYLDKIRKV